MDNMGCLTPPTGLLKGSSPLPSQNADPDLCSFTSMQGVPTMECLERTARPLATRSSKISPDDISSLVVSGSDQGPISKTSQTHRRNFLLASSEARGQRLAM